MFGVKWAGPGFEAGVNGCGTEIYPPSRRGNVTAIKDDGGIELTRPIIEKSSLQDLYPSRAGTHRSIAGKDDGGGVE
jgi:hypothetical protein